jgi:hypothetical protein
VSFWEHVSHWRSQGKAIIIVTHFLPDKTLVDRVVELSAPASAVVIGGGER